MSEEYDPIGCEHKKQNGLSAWMFQSEFNSSLGGNCAHKVVVSVCGKCGELKIWGHHDGNHFHEEFSIDHPDAIAAIVKQANWINEKTLFVPVSERDDKDKEIEKLKECIIKLYDGILQECRRQGVSEENCQKVRKEFFEEHKL